MKKTLIILALSCLFTQLFSQVNLEEKYQKIDSIINAYLVMDGRQPVYNFLLYGENGKTGFRVHKGAGIVGRNDQPIEADYQYKIASITKTLVATVILQLEEEGKLDINEKAGKYLNEIDFLTFPEIHILDKVSYSDSITIKHLLTHTSGIADIFSDKDLRFNISVLLNKKRQFTPQKIIKIFYRYKLNKNPTNRPGQGYHYSDVNYMLLGFIVEQITGKSLPQAVRERILDKVTMENTYFEYFEEVHGHGNMIDAYLNKINITQKINTSYEWAGGGYVSTVKDMADFIRALFSLELFKDPETLERMMDISLSREFGGGYGLGLLQYELNDIIFYGHGGFYGSILAYSPDKNLLISANIGQVSPPYRTRTLVEAILLVLEE